MIILVAGSRTFRDYELVAAVLDDLHAEVGEFRMIHGGASGADALADRWAKEHGITPVVCRPDWEQFGRAAGPMRNREMVGMADRVIVFWDGESRGTASTIEHAERIGKPYDVHLFTPVSRTHLPGATEAD